MFEYLYVIVLHECDADVCLLCLEESQKKKSVKSKKSPLSFFKKRNREASPHPLPTGKLFGHPLADVCNDNDIPKSLDVSIAATGAGGSFHH